MGKSNLLGAWGESLAANYLEKKRYRLVARGFRCRFGEIDLIVESKKYIVFVEVKLRRSAAFARAAEYWMSGLVTLAFSRSAARLPTGIMSLVSVTRTPTLRGSSNW